MRVPPWAWKVAAGVAPAAGIFCVRVWVRYMESAEEKEDDDEDGDPKNDKKDRFWRAVRDELPAVMKPKKKKKE